MFILKLVGYVIIAAIITFAVLLVSNITKLQKEIEQEIYQDNDQEQEEDDEKYPEPIYGEL